MKDESKGWLYIILSVAALIMLNSIIKEKVLLYSILLIPLFYGKILILTRPEQRNIRPIFRILLYSLIFVFGIIAVIATIGLVSHN